MVAVYLIGMLLKDDLVYQDYVLTDVMFVMSVFKKCSVNASAVL